MKKCILHIKTVWSPYQDKSHKTRILIVFFLIQGQMLFDNPLHKSWVNPLGTNLALNLPVEPWALCFTVKTHLQPTSWQWWCDKFPNLICYQGLHFFGHSLLPFRICRSAPPILWNRHRRNKQGKVSIGGIQNYKSIKKNTELYETKLDKECLVQDLIPFLWEIDSSNSLGNVDDSLVVEGSALTDYMIASSVSALFLLK